MSADDLRDCFSRNILKFSGGDTRWPLPPKSNSVGNGGQGYWYDVEVELPNVQCDRCVLQWIYHGGNNWGCDADGNCGMGYGAQEEFINCADIRISGDAPTTTSTTSTTTSTTTSL